MCNILNLKICIEAHMIFSTTLCISRSGIYMETLIVGQGGGQLTGVCPRNQAPLLFFLPQQKQMINCSLCLKESKVN